MVPGCSIKVCYVLCGYTLPATRLLQTTLLINEATIARSFQASFLIVSSISLKLHLGQRRRSERSFSRSGEFVAGCCSLKFLNFNGFIVKVFKLVVQPDTKEKAAE